MSSSNAWSAALGSVLLIAVVPASLAAENLAALRVGAERGQSAEQARRDRYECHNWAVDETGETPVAASADDRREPRRRRAKRAEPQSDYLRALTACLEGRGYSVALPSR